MACIVFSDPEAVNWQGSELNVKYLDFLWEEKVYLSRTWRGVSDKEETGISANFRCGNMT